MWIYATNYASYIDVPKIFLPLTIFLGFVRNWLYVWMICQDILMRHKLKRLLWLILVIVEDWNIGGVWIRWFVMMKISTSGFVQRKLKGLTFGRKQMRIGLCIEVLSGGCCELLLRLLPPLKGEQFLFFENTRKVWLSNRSGRKSCILWFRTVSLRMLSFHRQFRKTLKDVNLRDSFWKRNLFSKF